MRRMLGEKCADTDHSEKADNCFGMVSERCFAATISQSPKQQERRGQVNGVALSQDLHSDCNHVLHCDGTARRDHVIAAP